MIRPEELHFLEQALTLARRGGRATAPNPRVGCVIVAAGEIVGQGWHRRLGESHAEVVALREAGARARAATLYVSLEPCAHSGRTPPCTSAILSAGISRVIVGLIDPDHRVSGRGIAALRAGGIEVEIAEGPMATAAERVLEAYLVHRREGRAFALLKVASTLDGRIADRQREARWITGETAREHSRGLRDRYGAILVGVGTVLADDPSLLPPSGHEDGGAFLRCVLDSQLRTPPGSELLRKRWPPVLIFCGPDAPAERRRALEDAGAEIVVCSGAGELVPPLEILEELARRGVLGVIVEGGGVTHGHFLSAGAVDKIYWYLAPALLGDPGAVSALTTGETPLAQAWRGRIAERISLGEDLLLTLYP